MKKLCILFVLLAFAAIPALADKPDMADVNNAIPIPCGLSCVTWVWDGEFYTEVCDDQGGGPVWEYGVHANSEVPQYDCNGEQLGNVLATVLNGDTPNDAGERAVLGMFHVDGASYMLEFCHFYDVETSYDGGNVEINDGSGWVVIEPMGGYPQPEINSSTSFYAFCVDGEPGFAGHDPAAFLNDCFDLSDYIGMDVELAVTFGSDSSVAYPGWYIASIVAGGPVTALDESSWSTIKALY